MVDVDSVLLSVQERDKWRHRMEILERSLRDTRDRRHRLEIRLRHIHKELVRLRQTFEALHDMSRMPVSGQVARAPRGDALR